MTRSPVNFVTELYIGIEGSVRGQVLLVLVLLELVIEVVRRGEVALNSWLARLYRAQYRLQRPVLVLLTLLLLALFFFALGNRDAGLHARFCLELARRRRRILELLLKD